jgi:DNA-binding GntR family transcriptional regulator
MSNSAGLSSFKDMAYFHLWEGMATGKYPPGVRLFEAAVAEAVGISRTPVREAVNQLVSEGLLEQVPHFGTFVRSLDKRELGQLFEFRELLECHSIVGAAERRSETQLDELRRCYDGMASLAASARTEGLGAGAIEVLRSQTVALDLRFHTLLARAAGNAWVERSLTSSGVLTRVFAASTYAPIRSPREVVIENPARHAELLDAVTKRDPELARQRMSEEMRRTREEVLAHYREPAPEPAEASRRPRRLRDSAGGLRSLARGQGSALTAFAEAFHVAVPAGGGAAPAIPGVPAV